MLIKFDFSSKTGILVVKFAFAAANLKIETLRKRRRFARVFCYRVQFERMRAGKEKAGFSGFVQRASCLVTADRYHAGSGNKTGRWCFTFVQF